MASTMTYVGLDVHARSTHAAAIDVAIGELRRVRFGGNSEEVIGWLAALPQPLRGCYEAGPTGFALYRAASAVALRVDVIAPSKTPRASGDRIKSDRKDAELLARLLLAGQLKIVTVPSPSVQAARHLCRAAMGPAATSRKPRSSTRAFGPSSWDNGRARLRTPRHPLEPDRPLGDAVGTLIPREDAEHS